MSVEIADAVETYANTHGIPKRELFEKALIRQLALSPEDAGVGTTRGRRSGTKVVGAYIAVALANELEAYAARHGLSKAGVFEAAVARELGFEYVPGTGRQMHLLPLQRSQKAS